MRRKDLAHRLRAATSRVGVTGVMLKMVVVRGLSLAGIGIALGLVGALVLTRVMQGVLYGVTSTDPLTFGAVAVVLLIVASAASLIPALRATRVDPLVALRSE